MIDAENQTMGNMVSYLETTSRPTSLGRDDTRDTLRVVNPLIADGLALYEKTKKFSLVAAGLHDPGAGLLLDAQAQEIFSSMDALAELLRRMGAVTVRSISHSGELQGVENYERDLLSPFEMMAEVMADNRRFAESLRGASRVCERSRLQELGALLKESLDATETRISSLIEADKKPETGGAVEIARNKPLAGVGNQSNQVEVTMMETRLNYMKAAPGAVQAMYKLHKYVEDAGLEPALLELVKTRASQINGCAYCIDMHTKDARSMGETEQRLYLLNAWREAPFYTERERAALDWTEAVTLISEDHVPEEVYASARSQFSEQELVNLTMAIISINAWNRLAISFRAAPGEYQPKRMTAGN